MLALDLERYDFSKESKSLIRATEGTIIERLPPRIRIREGASLESPHILVLIDDPQKKVIEPIVNVKSSLEIAYDFDLMLDGGHLKGYFVNEPLTEVMTSAIHALTNKQSFIEKYHTSGNEEILLFAVGDGNHSLATAKSIWEKLKPQVGLEHPARYALVEVENIHDSGLEFEPIHRVIFNPHENFIHALKQFFGTGIKIIDCLSQQRLFSEIAKKEDGSQKVGMVEMGKFYIICLTKPSSNLPVGTIQPFLDKFMGERKADKIDYVHGTEVVTDLCSTQNNVGIYLPSMDKGELFRTVIKDGVLPRKTFSMGEAKDKRYYLECRKISLN